MELLLVWFALSVAVAIAANSRGRNPGAWLLLALITSPLLAAIFLFASRNLRQEQLLTAARRPQPADHRKLSHSPALGGRSSRVTVDRSAEPFDAEGVFAGIPYRVGQDGSIEALMQGARVRFPDMNVFVSQVGPPSTLR